MEHFIDWYFKLHCCRSYCIDFYTWTMLFKLCNYGLFVVLDFDSCLAGNLSLAVSRKAEYKCFK